ncbi:MAG: glycosyltransferase, partial [Planctomycetota bacterium]
MNARLSVITPTLNAAWRLEACLQSVAACSRSLAPRVALEHIIVDGGSEDATRTIIDAYRQSDDPSPTRVLVEPGPGVAAAINRGIEAAAGEFIVLLDADDVLMADGLLAALDRMTQDAGITVAYSDAPVIDEDGAVRERITARPWRRRRLMRRNILLRPAVVVRRSAFAGRPLDEQLRSHYDYDLWLRLMAVDARFARVPKPIGAKRQHRGNRLFRTMDRRSWRASADEMLAVVRRHRDEPSVR